MSLSCESPLWDGSDVPRCSRQIYFFFYPYVITIAISVLLLVTRTIPASIKYLARQSRKRDPSAKPLLASETFVDSDTDDSDNLQPVASETYGAVLVNTQQRRFSVRADRARLYGGQNPSSKDDTSYTVCHRGVFGNLTFALEGVCVIAQLVLATLPFTIRELYPVYEGYPYNVLVNMAFWLLAVSLYAARVCANWSKFLGAQKLWLHSTLLYTVAVISSAVFFRSAIVDPQTPMSKNFFVAQFAFCSVLFLISITATYADKPIVLTAVKGLQPSPEAIASILSRSTFGWLDPMVYAGYKRTLDLKDFWDLRSDDHAVAILKDFRKLKRTAGLIWRFTFFFKGYLWASSMWAIFYSLVTFIPTVLLKSLLSYVDDPSGTPKNVAWLYVIGMLLASILNNVGQGQCLFIGRRICVRMRSVIIGEIYSKAMRRKVSAAETKEKPDEPISGEAEVDALAEENNGEGPQQANLGAIINLMAVDAFKVSEVCAYLHFFVASIVLFAVSIWLLFVLIGWSALAGSLVMLLFMPANYLFSAQFSAVQKDLMGVTDIRIEKTNELLQSIRIIKFFAWEDKFIDGVNEVREKELKLLRRRAITWAGAGLFWYMAPSLVTVASFGVYTSVLGHKLTSPIAFTALSLFNIMRIPMAQFTEMLAAVLQSKVSIDRVEKFLSEDETSKYVQLCNPVRGPNSPYIGFENATVSWGKKESDFKLRDLNLSFKVGQLNLVIGPTGSGKTSLLLGLLGEMELEQGQVFLPGAEPREQLAIDPSTGFTESVAYCPQQAWLLNDTVRNNILFSSEYEPTRYQAVVKACGLERDFEILEAGDSTEVGEKGITLSGGQKQRISLARALYTRARHVILDDCLSAVDSHTAAWIYEHCITGEYMANRTCILVSHNVALTITNADKVIIIENGRIKGAGTPQEMADQGLLGDDKHILSSASVSASKNASHVNLPDAAEAAAADAESDLLTKVASRIAEETPSGAGKLTQEEARSEGTVPWSVYEGYMANMGGLIFWGGLTIAFVASQSAEMYQSFWIRQWAIGVGTPGDGVEPGTLLSVAKVVQSSPVLQSLSVFYHNVTSNFVNVEDETHAAHSAGYYLTIYFILAVVFVFLSVSKELYIFFGGLRASRKLFNELMQKVVYAKLRFFDSTPIGRIMNRFSKDVEALDQETAMAAGMMVQNFLACLATVVLITMITPSFLFFGIIIAGIYLAIGIFYLTTSRELKRLDSTTKSPIYQHFGETLVGVTTIRAYGDEPRFVRDNLEKVDTNNRPFFYLWVANRWLSFRVDLAGALVTFFAGASILMAIGKIDSGLAGVSLTYAILFSENVLWAVRLYAVNEMNMNSVERIQEYLDLDQEPPAVIEDSRPPANWPSKGEIEVNNLSLKYAPELPDVIKDVTFHVQPQSKVGIVGRTGAGKSTIITAFFRLIEAHQGSIKIDGVDIGKIGLKDLRRGLAIIPQDPTLFTGTIRTNLDPFDQYTDEQVFEALRRVHLIEDSSSSESDGSSSSAVATNENKNQFKDLSSAVTESGSNLSQGQRQLMCLARSLLKSPKVILLDEATASIDYETDAKIQKTIRSELNDTTILTIAHRLRSIIDYDQILVLDAGEVREYAPPHELLQDKDGVFYSLCADSGEFEALIDLAKEAYEKA
ncbi:P-loop containing nucleoside triphosphate hydrolase protein [Yarrowia lipolytica]|nr:P-loop containing nucleoside triphosphate hydrolase protein [Yarrowia lipolytica]